MQGDSATRNSIRFILPDRPVTKLTLIEFDGMGQWCRGLDTGQFEAITKTPEALEWLKRCLAHLKAEDITITPERVQ